MAQPPSKLTSWQDIAIPTSCAPTTVSTGSQDDLASATKAEPSHRSRFLEWLWAGTLSAKASNEEGGGGRGGIDEALSEETFPDNVIGRQGLNDTEKLGDDDEWSWSSDTACEKESKVVDELFETATESAAPEDESASHAPFVCGASVPGDTPSTCRRKKKRKRGKKGKKRTGTELATVLPNAPTGTPGTASVQASLPGIPIRLSDEDRPAVAHALQSSAARLAVMLETPEIRGIMNQIWALKADKTLTDEALVERLRIMGDNASIPTLTCSVLTQHAAWHGTEAVRAQRAAEGGRPLEENQRLSTDHVHPWSVELGSPDAYSLLDEHLTDEDHKLLKYFASPDGKKLRGSLFEQFVSRFSWAGKSYEAVRRKETLLHEYQLKRPVCTKCAKKGYWCDC